MRSAMVWICALMWYNFDVAKNKTNLVHKILVNNDKLQKRVNYYDKKL